MKTHRRIAAGIFALGMLTQVSLANFDLGTPTLVSSNGSTLGDNGYTLVAYGRATVGVGSLAQASYIPDGFDSWTTSTAFAARQLGLKYHLMWYPEAGVITPTIANLQILHTDTMDVRLGIGTSVDGPLFASWSGTLGGFSDSDSMAGIFANSRDKNFSKTPYYESETAHLWPDLLHPGAWAADVTVWGPTFATSCQVVLNGDSYDQPTTAGVVCQSMMTITVTGI